jgi:AcrR family transcriptional regulator
MALETRAISADQKKARRHVIISTTRKLFEQAEFNDINMETIAQEAGLAKGTVFFYFKTKEELFLALTQDEITKWQDIADIELANLPKVEKAREAEVFINFMAASLSANSIFLRLLSIIGSILEQNISYEAALNFKTFLRNRIAKTGVLFEQRLSLLKPGEGGKLYLSMLFLTLGICPMAFPSPVVKEVFDEPGMEIFRIDFSQAFKDSLALMLRGWREK